MPAFIDRRGHRYGRLFAIDAERRSDGRWYWRCECDCGNSTWVIARALSRNTGNTNSCGCLARERAADTARRRTTHGQSIGGKLTRTYRIWRGMIDRCGKPNNASFKYYGGRGIRVCKRWHEFNNFIQDMGDAPTDLTLERRNNNRGYYPSNCTWATAKEQVRNRRTSLVLKFRGRRQSLAAWCEELGIPYSRTYSRLTKLKWSVKDSLTRKKG